MAAVGTHDVLEQAERIAASPVLKNAESLRHLLLYLVRHSLEHPNAGPKELQIAVDVFRRPEDFDPRLDSTVRVQTSRLRSKIVEYYGMFGAADTVVIEIPKGSYSVVARRRDVPDPPVAPAPAVAPPAAPMPPAAGPPPGRWRWAAATAAIAVLSAAAGWQLAARRAGPPPSPAAKGPLETFWLSFLASPEPPLIVFSNAEFIGRPETGLRYLKGAPPPGASILDHYTGVGEVLSLHALSQMFQRLPVRHYLVKRGRLLNWDDTRNRDLIFLGSPSENLSLRDLPLAGGFRFERAASGLRKGDLAIVNTAPLPGEAPRYLASTGLPVTEDYAVVSLFPGPARPQWILLLAGTTTFGTQAAAEFVSSEAGASQLLGRLKAMPRPFSAVLRASIRGGVPVESKLAAFHYIDTH